MGDGEMGYEREEICKWYGYPDAATVRQWLVAKRAAYKRGKSLVDVNKKNEERDRNMRIKSN